MIVIYLSQLSNLFTYMAYDTSVNPHPANVFVLKMVSAFRSAAYIQVHFRIDFFYCGSNPAENMIKITSGQVDQTF